MNIFKQRRCLLGLKVTYVAGVVGVTPRTIYRWEEGHLPDRHLLGPLLAVLSLSFDDVAPYLDDKKPRCEFGSVMNDARWRCGLTVTALAVALGTSSLTINRWERGPQVPTEDAVERLETALGLQGDLFALWSPSPNVRPRRKRERELMLRRRLSEYWEARDRRSLDPSLPPLRTLLASRWDCTESQVGSCISTLRRRGWLAPGLPHSSPFCRRGHRKNAGRCLVCRKAHEVARSNGVDMEIALRFIGRIVHA